MITVTEAATRLGVHRNVVYRMVHNGELPAFRLPGRTTLMVDEAAVEAAKVPVPVHTGVDAEENYSLSAVARMLRCSPKTVRQLVADGRLEADRNPGYRSRVRVTAASTHAYLAQAQHRAEAAS